MPAVPGYFAAMKAGCERYGALMIFDEVMVGMGRTGTLHAWEQEGVTPDIQVIGKALGAGYIPISAVLINERVISAFKEGSGSFAHGQTYQSHPTAFAAALEVQRIMQRDNLLENVRCMGAYLEQSLHQRLDGHPHVGHIRGRGLFWGIEFVADKLTKIPFDSSLGVAGRIHRKGMSGRYDIAIFQATGCAEGGWNGDHILLAPPYTVSRVDVDEIVDRVCRVIEDVFKTLQ